jgi:hypothetical protein
MKKLSLAIVPFFLASSALADPATQQGADELAQVFQSYFGQAAEAISLQAKGDHYDLTLDMQTLFAQGSEAVLTGRLSPVALQLVDNGDGTWGVSMDQPVSLDLSMANAFDIQQDIASLSFIGTFDESLMAFTTAKSAFSGMTLLETIYTPNAPPQTISIALESGAAESTARAGAGGGSDFEMILTANGLTETMTAPAMPGEPAMPITVKAESLTQTLSGRQVMGAQIFQIAAWVASHPDDAAKEAGQAELKALLTAAMPFFGNLQGTGTFTMLSIDTPMGAMGIENLGFALDLNGAVADGKLQEAIAISGLTLPAGLVPDWAAPLVPQALSLDVQVSDFDPAAAITLALSALDGTAGSAMGPEFDAKLQAALLPMGAVTITLNPGALTGADYALTYQGAMSVNPDSEMPTGKATVTLTGADALTASLNEAPDDMKAQALMGFGMAQAMAKADGDKLIWEIDAATPGALTVNGMALMGGN